MCEIPTGLLIAPLPAKRQLWEAGDELTWKMECQKESGIQTTFGLATDGEIIRLEEDRLSSDDLWPSSRPIDSGTAPLRRSESWEDWCSGLDGFGGLVMLAASLVV